MDDDVMKLLEATEARKRLQDEALVEVGHVTQAEIGGVVGFVDNYAENREKNLWCPTDREHLEGVHVAAKAVKKWSERVLAGEEA